MLGEYLGAGSSTTKGLYHFNGTADDSSGNGNNGVSTNITWGGGKLGSGSASSSGNGYITTTSPILSNIPFTVSMYIKTNGGTNVCIVDNSGFNGFNRGVILGQFTSYPGKFYTRIMEGTNNFGNALVSNTSINDNKWHNIIYTYTNDTSANGIKLYIDGKLDNQITAVSSMGGPATGNLTFLKSSLDPAYYYTGLIDELIVEARVWTAEEVKKYYTFSQGKFIL